MRANFFLSFLGALTLLMSCTSSPDTLLVYLELPSQCDDIVLPDLTLTEEDTQEPDTAVTEIIEPDTTPEDVPPIEPPKVEVEGNRMTVLPEALEGLFIYGLGVEPGSALATVGNTVVGVIALPAILEVKDGLFQIRVLNIETLQPVPGEDGVIESYPATEEEDGRITIDFSEPETALEVQMWQNCVYAQQGYIPISEPLLADGLWTWAAVEHYQSKSCGNGGLPQSMGVNVHFLRRSDANPDFLPRKVAEDSPFGFFQTEVGDVTYLNRMPFVGEMYEDEQVVYYITDEFPDHLRFVVYDVMDKWNDALEIEAGNRPFKVVEGEPSMVAWDPRYRIIQWDATKGKGAIAPFIEDPFTGEMFETDVIVWLGNLDEVVDKYHTFFEEHPDAPIGDFDSNDGPVDPNAKSAMKPGFFNHVNLPLRVLRRRPVSLKPFGLRELHNIYQKLGKTLSNEELEAYVVADFLTHEIGHNLGLRHNFKASVDKDLHTEDETATSCMDYVVGMTAPGSYDRDAMAYGYGKGADEQGYVYCTDEDIGLDPGCWKWDYAHPVLHYISTMNKIIAATPADQDENEVQWKAEQEEWGNQFNRGRQFMSTDYELWDPENPVSTVQHQLDWVVCGDPAESPCGTHPFIRRQLALYLLYTKFSLQNEWQEFPTLSDDDAQLVMSTYYALLINPAQSMTIKEVIINKLPTSNVAGAGGLLTQLYDHLSAIEEKAEWESTLLQWVNSAMAE
jgi:hypothetical protein